MEAATCAKSEATGLEGRQVVLSRLNSERGRHTEGERENGKKKRERLMNRDFVPVTHMVADRVHTVQHHLRSGPSAALRRSGSAAASHCHSLEIQVVCLAVVSLPVASFSWGRWMERRPGSREQRRNIKR